MTTVCTTLFDQDTNPARILAGFVSMKTKPENTGDANMDADQQEVRRCLDGDSDAYARIVERHQSRVSSMMWRFTRQPVDHAELVQDVFVEVYRSLHRYKGRAPFEHWLSRIATRTGYRYWKRRQRDEVLIPIEEWDSAITWDPAELDPDQASENLFRLLASLPPRDRLVLTLRYFEDLDVAETAGRTGWSETMVKVQTHRARGKLKTLLEQSAREEKK